MEEQNQREDLFGTTKKKQPKLAALTYLVLFPYLLLPLALILNLRYTIALLN